MNAIGSAIMQAQGMASSRAAFVSSYAMSYFCGGFSQEGLLLYIKNGTVAPIANNSTAQRPGTSVLFDGSGSGTITGLLTTATFTVGTGSGVPTCTVAGRLDGAAGVYVWGLKIFHAGVLFADLEMSCGDDDYHPTTELSATPGLQNCVWSGFADKVYNSHFGGSGFDSNVLGWGVDVSGNYTPYGHANSVTSFKGPIAADILATDVPCLLADSSGYASIPGLLTTDVITTPSGTAPTCTTDGRMDFTDTENVYHITVTRGGTIWEFFPCETSEGTLLEGIENGYNGTLIDFAGNPWSTREGQSLAIENGFSVGRVTGYNYTPSALDYTKYSLGSLTTIDSNATIHLLTNSGGSYSKAAVRHESGAVGHMTEVTVEVVSYTSGDAVVQYNGGVNKETVPRGVGVHKIQLINDGTVGSIVIGRKSGGITTDIHLRLISIELVITGTSVCNSNGLHQDGSLPQYPRNTWINKLNWVGKWLGAKGPESQAIELLRTPFNMGDQPTISDDGKVIIGAKGAAVYSESQLDNAEVLDKVLGVLGEELVVNGGFDSDLSSWVASNSMRYGDGSLIVDSGGFNTFVSQDTFPVEVGVQYRCNFDIVSDNQSVGSDCWVTIGGYTHRYARRTPGSFYFVFTASSTIGLKLYKAGHTGETEFDNISVKQLTRN